MPISNLPFLILLGQCSFLDEVYFKLQLCFTKNCDFTINTTFTPLLTQCDKLLTHLAKIVEQEVKMPEKCYNFPENLSKYGYKQY